MNIKGDPSIMRKHYKQVVKICNLGRGRNKTFLKYLANIPSKSFQRLVSCMYAYISIVTYHTHKHISIVNKYKKERSGMLLYLFFHMLVFNLVLYKSVITWRNSFLGII